MWLVLLARLEKQPGRRRLTTRDEIRTAVRPGTGRRLAGEGRLSNLLKERVQSTLSSGRRDFVRDQPAHLCTGMSPAEERERLEIVERHFSFGALDATAAAALAAELVGAGSTLDQGLGLRNQLYREKQLANVARVERLRAGGAAMHPAWELLPVVAEESHVPPLDVLRAALEGPLHPKTRRLSSRLARALVEAIVQANANGALNVGGVSGSARLRKLEVHSRRAATTALRLCARQDTRAGSRAGGDGDADDAPGGDGDAFWAAAAWACSNDLQGASTKHTSQRNSRAAERLVSRKLRAAGVRYRTEQQLQARTSTPDFVLDSGELVASLGVRWVDVKHAVGRGDSAAVKEQVAKYCADWGPGAVIYTRGYSEEFARRLREEHPVWVLDSAAGRWLLSDEPDQALPLR